MNRRGLMMREMTSEELERYNGQDGAAAYIACEGKIYDVSSSFLWQKGRHQVVHLAGIDLTAALDTAPHGADLLARFPIVGILVAE